MLYRQLMNALRETLCRKGKAKIMYVYVCKCVTDGDVRETVCEGTCSMRELRTRLEVATQCGRCAQHVQRLFQETRNAAPCEENNKAA